MEKNDNGFKTGNEFTMSIGGADCSGTEVYCNRCDMYFWVNEKELFYKDRVWCPNGCDGFINI